MCRQRMPSARCAQEWVTEVSRVMQVDTIDVLYCLESSLGAQLLHVIQ